MLSPRSPPLEAPTIQDALTCARPVANEVGAPLFHGSDVDLHHLLIYIAGPCMILAVLSSLFLMWKHLHRFTAPQEQRQILRIVFLPIAYAVFNFISLIWYRSYLYIKPIADIFEAIAIAALFLLVLEYVAPDGTDRDEFFEKLEQRNRRGQVIEGGSLTWYRNTYMSCLQYPLSKLVITIIQIITQYYAVYCENSWSPHYAHLYLQLVDYFFIGGSLGACIGFVRRFRHHNVDPIHKMQAKARTLIPLVLLQLLQNLIFGIACGKFFHPTPTATFNDVYFGVPAFMTCVEALLFSLLFQWSFGSREFRESARWDRYGMRQHPQRQPFFRALGSALNIADIVGGTLVAFQMIGARLLGRLQRGRSFVSSTSSSSSSSSKGPRTRQPQHQQQQPKIPLEDRDYLQPPPPSRPDIAHHHKPSDSSDDTASAASGAPLVPPGYVATNIRIPQA